MAVSELKTRRFGAARYTGPILEGQIIDANKRNSEADGSRIVTIFLKVAIHVDVTAFAQGVITAITVCYPRKQRPWIFPQRMESKAISKNGDSLSKSL